MPVGWTIWEHVQELIERQNTNCYYIAANRFSFLPRDCRYKLAYRYSGTAKKQCTPSQINKNKYVNTIKLNMTYSGIEVSVFKHLMQITSV